MPFVIDFVIRVATYNDSYHASQVLGSSSRGPFGSHVGLDSRSIFNQPTWYTLPFPRRTIAQW
jgi:hypothetical protein